MDLKGVESLIVQIDSFLKNKITKNPRSEGNIETFRQTNAIEVTIHGNTTTKVNICWLEERFRSEGDHRRVIPSHDILQYHAKFPLHETSEGFLKELHKKFEKRMDLAESTIFEKVPLINEQVSSNETNAVVAQNIMKMFHMPNESVKKQLIREIETALDNHDEEVKRTEIIQALKVTMAQGIEINLKSENKAKWGALNNRRGQIGENRTAAAMANVLESFMGISVMGMKTHTFLAKFLESLDIQLTYCNEYDPLTKKLIKANEVEHDNVSTWVEQDIFVIAMVQSKVAEIKPSKSNEATETQVAVKHVKHALNQVHKDYKTFQEIFPDIPESLLNRIRFKYFVSLSDVSSEAWPSSVGMEHIIFKDDVEDSNLLRAKLGIPDSAPDPASISEDLKQLHYIIGARYLGMASFIQLKTPQEGFSYQKKLLKNARTGYEKQFEKVLMMGKEQQAIFQAELPSYCVFGGHGSGKTVLLQANIHRAVNRIVSDQVNSTKHLLLICIWQMGADNLLNQYRELEKTLPVAENLEIRVVTKDELMKMYKATHHENEATTLQINRVCQNISTVEQEKIVHLFVDECWITVPKKFSPHMTQMDPNEIVGHIPFMKGSMLYPWSKLDPFQVKLIVAIMPDCQHLLEKDLITAPPPDQGHVFTFFAPKSFRTTVRIHKLIKHIEERVELDLRVWRYLLPPNLELPGHEIMGSQPVWQPIIPTNHFICETDECEQCYLRIIEKPLLIHYSDAINIHGAKPEDIVFILNSSSSIPEAILAMKYLKERFPQVDIQFDQEMEGMEKSLVFNLTNAHIGAYPLMIPLSLTRANNHLVIFCGDHRKILHDATNKGLIRRSNHNVMKELSEVASVSRVGLDEAVLMLCCLSRKITLPEIECLASQWDVRECYEESINERLPRYHIVKTMSELFIQRNPNLTMHQFMETLTSVNMKEPVALMMADTLNNNICKLKEMITTGYLTSDQQVELAHSLGKRELFNKLTQPTDMIDIALPDPTALSRCVDEWKTEAMPITSTDELVRCLQKANLLHIVSEIEYKTDDSDILSLRDMTRKEKILTSVFDIFIPLITILVTLGLLAVLFTNGEFIDAMTILIIHWVPSSFYFTGHLYYNNNIIGIPFTVFVILLYPISNHIFITKYSLIRRRSAGFETERYHMKQMLQLADASAMMNNFTSILMISYFFHLLNKGTISEENQAIFILSTMAALLHLISLLMKILKTQNNPILWCSLLSSVILKIGVIILLLNANTAPSNLVFFCSFLVLVIFMVNFWLEKKLTVIGTHENRICLRAAHSLIFPIPLENQNTKSFIPCMQLLLGNLGATIMGFSMTLFVGVREDKVFITNNIIQVIGVQVLLLNIFSFLVHFCSVLQTKSSTDILQEDDEDDISETTPLIGNQINSSRNSSYICKPTLIFALLLLLVLILTSAIPMLLYLFNTCPPLQTTQHSTINCTKTTPTYGTTCTLTCPPLYCSADFPDNRCELGGRWSVAMFTCRPQVAAMIGSVFDDATDSWIPRQDIYPPTERSHPPGLPADIIDGSAAFIQGRILHCGGMDRQDPSVSPLKTCFSLHHSNKEWQEETFPLLQEVFEASVSPIEDGKAMLIMGGKYEIQHVLSSSQIVRPGSATTEGPPMREWVTNHCSVGLQGDQVMITGGRRQSEQHGSKVAEILHLQSSQWEDVGRLQQARIGHTCSPVWVDQHGQGGDIFNKGAVSNNSVISVVVAGGDYLDDAWHLHPTYSAEVYLPWNKTWLLLPSLPTFQDTEGHLLPLTDTQIFSLNTGGGYYLYLLGGMSVDFNRSRETETNGVWVLEHNSTGYYWDNNSEIYPNMDMSIATVGYPTVAVPKHWGLQP